MYNQTVKNKSPAWLLTELAIDEGRELSKKHHVDERLVLTALYLAHTIFSQEFGGDIQKSHPALSAEFAKKYLDKWGVNNVEQGIILESIKEHHTLGGLNKSKIVEVVKNAEGFKFVTVEGSLIWLHDLGRRQVPFDEAVEKVIKKMEQKMRLLTLSDCIEEAQQNCLVIRNIFLHNSNIISNKSKQANPRVVVSAKKKRRW
ncbi:MAG: hypothetical protein WCI04_02390 [archaeon]